MTGRRRIASCLVASLLSSLLAAPAPAQPQQPPVPQPPFPQRPLPQQPLPQFPQGPQQPQPQKPSLPERPTLTVQAAPTFTGAALLPGSRFVLFSAAQIETVEGLCTDPSGNNVCRLLAPAYKATLNGQAASVCRLAGADLTCTLPATIAVGDGQTVTVTLAKTAVQVGGAAATTSKSFTAYQCAPAIAGITASGNAFTLAGTGLQPALAAFTRTLHVSETAQGQPIAQIPATIGASTATSFVATLDHPNLSKKILRFQLDMSCPGWSAATSNVVLRDSTPNGGPFGQTRSTNREFRMPGALDTNAALDASSTAQVWAPGANTPASNVHIVVGNGSYTFQTFLVNRGAAIANLSLEFTTSGPLALGSIYGNVQLPAVRQLANINTTIPFTCSVTTAARYRCEVPSFPAGASVLWQVMMPFFATGAGSATGGVSLRTFGPTATDQFSSLPLTIDYDAANTADRAVSPLTFTSAVVPGTDYTKAQFAALTGHVVRATLTNKGPATLNPPLQIGVTVQSPSGAAGEWRIDPGSPLPAGCTNDTPLGAFLFFRCSVSSPLGANQTFAFDLPVKLSGGRKLTPPPPQSFIAWPPCGAACIPKGLEVRVSLMSFGTPLLDPDRSNDFSPRIAGPNGELLTNPRQAVTICPTSWTVSEQTPSGEFNKLRCGP
jgi:hypothetical protein